MSGIYTGSKSYHFGGKEGTALSGDPSSDQNIPMNPMINVNDFPEVEYKDETIRTYDSLAKKIIYSGELPPKEFEFETQFQDPFWMLMFFTEKTKGGTWVSGVGEISASFSAITEVDTMFIQYHIHKSDYTVASPEHIDRLLKGCLPMKYSWVFEKGQLMKEKFIVKSLSKETVVNPMNCSADFHDGAFTVAAIAEVSTIVAKAAASIGDGDYFYLYGPSGSYSETKYYVWFDQQGAEQADPAPSGATEVTIDISGDTTAQDVSDAITAVIHGLGTFSAANGSGSSETVTVTATNGGHATDIVDVDSTLTLAVTTQGEEILGGWAGWDDTGLVVNGVATGKRSSSDSVIHFDDAIIPGLSIEKAVMEMDVGYTTEQVKNSASHTIYYRNPRNFKLILTGVLTNKTVKDQIDLPYRTRSKKTVKVYYDTTSGREKYMQCTNCTYVPDGSDISKIPEAGKPLKVTVVIEAGEAAAISFSGKFDTLVDPDALMSN